MVQMERRDGFSQKAKNGVTMQTISSLICSPAEQIARYKAAHARLMGPEKPRFVMPKTDYRLKYGFTRTANVTTNAIILADVSEHFKFITGRDFVRRIMVIVGKHQGVSIEHILSPRRAKNVVFARHLAVYLAVKHTKFSFPVIGRLFADRDHSTISYVRDKITKERASDPKVDALLSSLEAEILKERPAVWG